MNNELYQIERIGQNTIVFATSYVNPISYVPQIEADLIELQFNGEIFFDLLLCNGNAVNRFIKGTVTNGIFVRQSLKIVTTEDLDETIVAFAKGFYRSNQELVENNYILMDEDKLELLTQ